MMGYWALPPPPLVSVILMLGHFSRHYINEYYIWFFDCRFTAMYLSSQPPLFTFGVIALNHKTFLALSMAKLHLNISGHLYFMWVHERMFALQNSIYKFWSDRYVFFDILVNSTKCSFTLIVVFYIYAGLSSVRAPPPPPPLWEVRPRHGRVSPGHDPFPFCFGLFNASWAFLSPFSMLSVWSPLFETFNTWGQYWY